MSIYSKRSTNPRTIPRTPVGYRGPEENFGLQARKLMRMVGNALGGPSAKVTTPGHIKRLKGQRSIAKLSHHTTSIAANVKQIKQYMTKEGKAVDDGKPLLYGNVEPEVLIKCAKEGHRQSRVKLSPEFGGRMDMEQYTRIVVKQWEGALGRKFNWVAANHYDNGHPHSHIIIDQFDTAGQEIFFPRKFVPKMSEIAGMVATQFLGGRVTTREDDKKRLQSLIWLKTDTALFKLFDSENRMTRGFIDTLFEYVREDVLIRLSRLRDAGLVEFTNGTFQLKPDAEYKLRSYRRHSEMIEAEKFVQYGPPRSLVLFDAQSPLVIFGKVSHVGTMKEHADENYAVIESVDGKSYFVPLLNRPNCKQGDIVRLEVSERSGRCGKVHARFATVTEETFKGYFLHMKATKQLTPSGFGLVLDEKYSRNSANKSQER